MSRRVFSKGSKNITKSIRLSEEMYSQIEKLADEEGLTAAAYMVILMDERMQKLSETGRLALPADEKKSIKKKSRAV